MEAVFVLDWFQNFLPHSEALTFLNRRRGLLLLWDRFTRLGLGSATRHGRTPLLPGAATIHPGVGQNMQQLLDDLPSTLIALAVVLGDVVLHLAGRASGPFDESVPIIVAVIVAGRVARNGKAPKPPG